MPNDRYFLLANYYDEPIPILKDNYENLKKLRSFSTYCPICDVLTIYYATSARAAIMPIEVNCEECGHHLNVMEGEL